MIPSKLTPAELRDELGARGHSISLRALRLWRAKGILPPLKSRGRGRGRGRLHYWRSPKLLGQALAAAELIEINYPNDEARLALWRQGYPVNPKAVRQAHKSTLGKLGMLLDRRRQFALEKRGAPFWNLEDELSATTTNYARDLTQRFPVQRDLMVQLVIDLFGLCFANDYRPDISIFEQMSDVLVEIGEFAKGGVYFTDEDALATLHFIQRYMSFHAVEEIMATATDCELHHGHRLWRALLKLVGENWPTDSEILKFMAMGFGRFLIPAIIRMVREGKSEKIRATLTELRYFSEKFDVAELLLASLKEEQTNPTEHLIKIREMLNSLSRIWNWQRFPFRL